MSGGGNSHLRMTQQPESAFAEFLGGDGVHPGSRLEFR